MAVHRPTPPGSRAVGAGADAGEFIQIDFGDVARLASMFRELPGATTTQLRVAAKDAANLVADQAKENASFSSWIPSAIVTQAPLSSSTIASVRVRSSRAPTPDHAPLPRLLEFGTPFFRHPVWGTDNWVSQGAHPFMGPALKEKGSQARERLVEAVLSAARLVGFDA